jgi:hypothetical protein
MPARRLALIGLALLSSDFVLAQDVDGRIGGSAATAQGQRFQSASTTTDTVQRPTVGQRFASAAVPVPAPAAPPPTEIFSNGFEGSGPGPVEPRP